MGRIARKWLVDAESRNHCTWQAHDRQRLLDHPGARQQLYELMLAYKAIHGILIFAYCLMGSHIHVKCRSPRGQVAFSAFWHDVNHAFAVWYNARTGRRGQVVMQRMKSGRIQGGRHMLGVMRYIDRNPVNAGLVRKAKHWPWSSYRHYAFGAADPLVDDAPEYLSLGRSAAERRKSYRALAIESRPQDDREHEFDVAAFIGEPAWIERCRAAIRSPGPS